MNVQVIGRQGMLLQRRKRKSVAVATKASAGKAHPSSQWLKRLCVCVVSCRLANKKEKSQLNEPNEKRPLFNLYNEGSGDVSSSRDRTTTRCCYQRLVYIYIYHAHTHTSAHAHWQQQQQLQPERYISRKRERERDGKVGKKEKNRKSGRLCVWRGAGPKNAEAKATAPSVASRLLSTTNVCFSSASSHLSCLENEREREREAPSDKEEPSSSWSHTYYGLIHLLYHLILVQRRQVRRFFFFYLSHPRWKSLVHTKRAVGWG